MSITEAQKRAVYKYKAENIKRVPLDVQKDEYAALKAAADSAGIGVNAYIKEAIREKMSRDGAANEKAGTPDESEAPA